MEKKLTEIEARRMIGDARFPRMDGSLMDQIISRWREAGHVAPGPLEQARELVNELDKKARQKGAIDSSEVIGYIKVISEQYERAIVEAYTLV